MLDTGVIRQYSEICRTEFHRIQHRPELGLTEVDVLDSDVAEYVFTFFEAVWFVSVYFITALVVMSTIVIPARPADSTPSAPRIT